MSRAPRVALKHLPPEQRERARAERKRQAEALRAEFARWCQAHGIPAPTPEHQFAPPRRWRMDWAWLEQRVYLEMQGGIWTNGGHNRGSGYVRDMEKFNAAAVAGWRLLLVVPEDLFTEATAQLIRNALGVQSQ